MKELEEVIDLQNNGGVLKQLGLELGDSRRIIVHDGSFQQIISLENLFLAWREFCKDKRNKVDVQDFELHLEDNIFAIYEELKSGTKRQIKYEQFHITDPKPRIINKTSVAERLIHQAIYQILMPIFDRTFIFDSYSCRKQKGTHKAFRRLVSMARKQSKNYSRICWALKCDIRKFFHSIDHRILINLLSRRIADEKLMNLLAEIIESFESLPGKGMPLGNLTSQLFANIYMDPLDKFVKHKLKARYYLRYADDFMFLADNQEKLLEYLEEIKSFLGEHLKLLLHPDKIILRKLSWGLDFVGYVAYPKFNLPRSKTVQRMFARLDKIQKTESKKLNESLQSYLGYLKHIAAKTLSHKLNNQFGNRWQR
ncbi:MAG: hypothetical protein CEN89_591 [Candidatus Berkelbacteria bacterium Licking1014_7]|uniref:Reverse transcriptase domain-containing protein n=1 Tax=Candidatus Berkelbacteria bacterium Licking1014_7 TaxID=2017147 RepID=A0A554LI81_9BACT|nr:MAG: hypothetical protein CEN89_591 [Candidatus Berkelbacteria bacterium Licking1014_7]